MRTSSDTLSADSMCTSVMDTGWQSAERKKIAMGLDAGRTVEVVIGAGCFRCGDGALFNDDCKVALPGADCRDASEILTELYR